MSLLETLSDADKEDLDCRLADVSSGNSYQGTRSYLFDELLELTAVHASVFKPVLTAHGLSYQDRIGTTGLMGLSLATLHRGHLEIDSLSHYWGGDPDRHTFMLPLRYLLPDGLARMARDAQLLAKGLARIAAAKAKQEARRTEAKEKAMLVSLLAKYGLPEGSLHAKLPAKLQAMHRRAQRAESAQRKLQVQLDECREFAALMRGVQRSDFNRMCAAHKEVGEIFKVLTEVYDYPEGGQALHSVSDQEGVTHRAAGVWANCYLSRRHGGVQSFRVLDEVRRAVDELKAKRGNHG